MELGSVIVIVVSVMVVLVSPFLFRGAKRGESDIGIRLLKL